MVNLRRIFKETLLSKEIIVNYFHIVFDPVTAVTQIEVYHSDNNTVAYILRHYF